MKANQVVTPRPTPNPTPRPTARPTEFPTSTPTLTVQTRLEDVLQLMLENISTSAFSQQYYAQATLDLSNSTSTGGCASWLLETAGNMKLTRNTMTVHALSMLSSTDFGPVSRYTCKSNATVLLDSILSPNSVGSSIICDGNVYNTKLCPNQRSSTCLGCVNPCHPTCASKVSFNPCGYVPARCGYAYGTASILAVDFVNPLPPPNVTVVSHYVTKTSLLLTLLMSASGTLNVGIFPQGTIVTSADQVTAQNMQYATRNSRQIEIVIPSLQPATSYDIYFSTQSLTGSAMVISEVRATRMRITSQCCRVITVGLSKLFATQRTDLANVLTFSVSSRPTRNITLLFSFTGSKSNNVSYPFPSSFQFSSKDLAATSLTGISSVTKSSTRNAELLTLSTSLFGLDAPLYAVEYSNGNTLNILAVTDPPAAPLIRSCVFDSTGTVIVANFDVETDKSGSFSSAIACSTLFSFTGVSNAVCLWAAANQILINLGSTAVISVGDRIHFIGTNVRTACPVSTSSCVQSSAALAKTLIVAPPATIPIPNVAVSTPQLLSICTPLTIDISSSTGSAGRDWVNMTYHVRSATSSNQAVATNIEAYLNQSFSISPPTRVPISYLQAGTYSIVIGLCNFLGGCSESTAVVTIVVTAVPFVQIIGDNFLVMKSTSTLRLTSNAYIPSCDTSVAVNNNGNGLLFVWSVVRDNVPQLNLASEAKEKNVFLKSPFTFAANSVYKITLQALDPISTLSTFASVKVQVIQSDIVVVIPGGLTRSVAYGSLLTLDAASSYDEDQRGVTGVLAGLSFAWSCNTVKPAIVSSCSLTVLSSLTAAAISLKAGSNSVNTTSSLTVKVYDSTRVALSTISVATVGASVPIISLTSGLKSSKLNPFSKLSISATVAVSYTTACTWSINDTSIALATAALTPIISTIRSAVATNFSFSLGLSASTLGARSTYAFSLVCTVATGQSSSAVVNIVTNGPPVPGSVTISPRRGIELHDVFLFVASLWTDPDFPITYAFGFVSPSSGVQIVQARSQIAYASSTLPAGTDATNYTLSCIVQIYDVLNANISSFLEPQVRRIANNAQLNTAVLSQISSVSRGTSDEVRSVVSTASAALNFVSCNESPNCAKLNRFPCSKTKDTCGPCLSTKYAGVEGDSNLQCYALPDTRTQGQLRSLAIRSCRNATQCQLFETCNNGVCLMPSKSCPQNCSGYGTCRYLNLFTGLYVATCTLADSTCAAQCDCNSGFGDSACGTVDTVLLAKQSTRLLLLSALQNLTDRDDASQATVTSWLSNLQSLTQVPSELSERSLRVISSICNSICSGAISAGLSYDELTPMLYVLDSTLQVVNRILNTADAMTDIGNRRRLENVLEVHEDIRSFIYSYARVVFDNIVPGQQTVDTLLSSVRMRISSVPKSNGRTTSMALTLPLSGVEVYDGLSLTSSSIDAILTKPSEQLTVMMAEISISSYGATNLDKFLSSPVLFAVDKLSAQDEVTSLISIDNFRNVTYEYPPEHITRHTTYCAAGAPQTFTHSCPSGISVSATCDGVFVGKIYSNCSYYESKPFCSDISANADSIDLTTFSGSCSTAYFDSTTSTCSCPLQLVGDYILPGGSTIQRSEIVPLRLTKIVSSAAVTQTFFPTSVPTSYPTSPIFHTEEYLLEWLDSNKVILIATGSAVVFFLLLVVYLIYQFYAHQRAVAAAKLDSLVKTWPQDIAQESSIVGVEETEYPPVVLGPTQEEMKAQLAALVVNLTAVHYKNMDLRRSLGLPTKVIPYRVGHLLSNPNIASSNLSDIQLLSKFHDNLLVENIRFEESWKKKAKLEASVSVRSTSSATLISPQGSQHNVFTDGENEFWDALGERTTGLSSPPQDPSIAMEVESVMEPHPLLEKKLSLRFASGFFDAADFVENDDTTLSVADSNIVDPTEIPLHFGSAYNNSGNSQSEVPIHFGDVYDSPLLKANSFRFEGVNEVSNRRPVRARSDNATDAPGGVDFYYDFPLSLKSASKVDGDEFPAITPLSKMLALQREQSEARRAVFDNSLYIRQQQKRLLHQQQQREPQKVASNVREILARTQARAQTYAVTRAAPFTPALAQSPDFIPKPRSPVYSTSLRNFNAGEVDRTTQAIYSNNNLSVGVPGSGGHDLLPWDTAPSTVTDDFDVDDETLAAILKKSAQLPNSNITAEREQNLNLSNNLTSRSSRGPASTGKTMVTPNLQFLSLSSPMPGVDESSSSPLRSTSPSAKPLSRSATFRTPATSEMGQSSGLSLSGLSSPASGSSRHQSPSGLLRTASESNLSFPASAPSDRSVQSLDLSSIPSYARTTAMRAAKFNRQQGNYQY